jgi:hypothetical protein
MFVREQGRKLRWIERHRSDNTRNYLEDGSERRRVYSGIETFATVPMLLRCNLEQHRKKEKKPAPLQQASKVESEEEEGSGGSTSVSK